jgi:hypothetical protein
LKVGDSVLVKQEKKDKLTTPFNPTPLKIKEKKGSMIIATDGQNKIIPTFNCDGLTQCLFSKCFFILSFLSLSFFRIVL